MKTLILRYAISTVQYNSRMKVGNTISIDDWLYITVYWHVHIVSACLLEEAEARVYGKHVPPPLQITIPSLVERSWSVWSYVL